MLLMTFSLTPTLACKIPENTKNPNCYLSATNNKSVFVTSIDIGEILTVKLHKNLMQDLLYPRLCLIV